MASTSAAASSPDLVELVLLDASGARIGSRMVGPKTTEGAVQQWAREQCGWVGLPGSVYFRLEGCEADFGFELLHDMGDTKVHVVAHMCVPPAAPAAPDQEYKRGRSMASRAKVRDCLRTPRVCTAGALAEPVPPPARADRASSPPR